MITAEHRRVYTFAPVIPGRRRRFTRIADAYRALAEQLIERRYSYRGTRKEWARSNLDRVATLRARLASPEPGADGAKET